MEIDKIILNIPQLKIVVDRSIEDNNSMLKKEIRVIGLREKIERRQITLGKIQTLLVEHTDVQEFYTDCSGCGADLRKDAITCYCDDCI